MRWFIATLAGLLALTALAVAAIGEAPPSARVPLAIDAHAFTAQLIPKIKAPDVRPAPKLRPPRIKHNIDRFNRFEFDQRSIA